MERLGYTDKRIQVDGERTMFYVSKNYDKNKDIDQFRNNVTIQDLLNRYNVNLENVDFSQVDVNDLNLTDIQKANLNMFDISALN